MPGDNNEDLSGNPNDEDLGDDLNGSGDEDLGDNLDGFGDGDIGNDSGGSGDLFSIEEEL